MASPRERFVDLLPAVLRSDEVGGENFLDRFLRAFETLFAGVQEEIASIPDLFSALPAAALARPADAGEGEIELAAGAGLAPGDLLMVRGPGGPAEFVAVERAGGERVPRVALRAPLRFAHPAHASVRRVGPAAGAGTLAVDAPAASTALVVPEAAELGIAPGDALRVGEGEAAEHVRAVRVEGVAVAIEPPLARGHPARRPVVRLEWAASRTPPPAFAHAPVAGPTTVLTADARAGSDELELDAFTGLRVGDVLRVGDPDPERTEFVRLRALPPLPAGPGVLRGGVRLVAPLRFPHPRGVPLEAVRPPARGAVLAAGHPAGTGRVRLDDGVRLLAAPGERVRIGTGVPEEVEVLSVEGDELRVFPPLGRAHRAGAPVWPAAEARAAGIVREAALAEPAPPGAAVVRLAEPIRGLEAGMAVAVGGRAAEHARTAAVDGTRVEVAPPLERGHAAGAVLRLVERGAGEAPEPARRGTLREAVPAGGRTLRLREADAPDLAAGDLLLVGDGPREHAVVRSAGRDEVTIAPPCRHEHPAGTAVRRVERGGGGTDFVAWLASWIGEAARADRGELWNRAHLASLVAVQPWRGTRAGVEGYLERWLAGAAEAEVQETADGIRVGLVSTVGRDTWVCGGPPDFFRVRLRPDPRRASSYRPGALCELARDARDLLDRERPAHTWYELRVHAPSMQLARIEDLELGARVGVTTSLGGPPWTRTD